MISPGDIVSTPYGERLMTAYEVKSGMVFCRWFEGFELKEEWFKESNLVKV